MADPPRFVDLVVGALGLLAGAWNAILALAVSVGGGIATAIGVEVTGVSPLLGALLLGLGVAMFVSAAGLFADRPWGWFAASVAWSGAYLKNLADAVSTGSISAGMLVVLLVDLGIVVFAVASIQRLPRIDAGLAGRVIALGAAIPGLASRRSDGASHGSSWEAVDGLARAVVDGLRDAGHEANVRTHDDWTFVLTGNGGESTRERLIWLTVDEAVTKERVQRFHELARNAGADQALVVHDGDVAVPGRAMAEELDVVCFEASDFLSRLSTDG